MIPAENRRILLVDDVPEIHEDFRKVLVDPPSATDLDDMEAAIFGRRNDPATTGFELDSASQGRDAVAMVRSSLGSGRPYAVAFVDMRMPPGWDGVETAERMWRYDPRIQIVICTAYSDHSWDKVIERLVGGDRLLILKKPFDAIEVYQLASSLTAKWQMTRQAESKRYQLERLVRERTAELRRANRELQEDIAERKRTEAELKLAASVFHHTMNGIMIIDSQARIVSANPAFTAITGYRVDEVSGHPLSLLRSGFNDATTHQAMSDSLARDGCWEGEIWNRRKNGEAFLARLSISRVTGDEGSQERYVGIFNDVTELRRKDERIRYLAFHDQLTGLPNQALLIDRLEESIAFARRDSAPFGIMFIDLDRFKAVNDSLGHDIGNGLLREVACRLRTCLRQSDTVARIGGDEFVLLLRGISSPEEYAGLAKKIIEDISRPIEIARRAIQVGASVGIACFPDDGGDPIELMKHADAAMYVAKSSGRGTFRFFQPEMTAKAEQRLQLEMELRNAVRNGELELRYQPKVSMTTNEMCGVEALVRWRHPTHGLMSPAEFIPLAEEAGIIDELGDWVLEAAFRQSSAWQRTCVEKPRIGINISAKQLEQGDLTGKIASLSERYGVPPSDFEIELTESVIMSNPAAISSVFSRLRQVGVRVAVDDFGTGYSSLAYLRHLPIDVLKIDRSFIKNADRDPSDAQIVKTIIALGRALNLTVIAEGVETRSQMDFLTSCGCPAAQGNLFSRPLTVTEFEAWHTEHHHHRRPSDGSLNLAAGPGRPG